MSTVHLTTSPSGAHRLLVDGHDLSMAVSRENVEVDLSDLDHPRVTVTLLPTELHLDLPDATVEFIETQRDTDAHERDAVDAATGGGER